MPAKKTPAKAAKPVAAKPVKGGRNILLVEDDQFLAKILGKTLESNGYNVTYAITGKEGLTKADHADPQLIVLDIILPDIDGFELLGKFKANPRVKGVPVIIVSNLGQEEDVQRGMALGASDYIIKSDLSLNDIVAKVKKYV